MQVLSKYRFYSTCPSPPLINTSILPAPHTGHIRILSLSSPQNRNAISRQLLSELSAWIDIVKKQAEDEWDTATKARDNGPIKDGEKVAVGQGTRVLILASEIDEVFCAGADLKERKGMSKDELMMGGSFPIIMKKRTHAFLTQLRATLSTLSALPIPTISAVSSVAFGGGLELALATTFRVMASTATVGLPETKLGIIPGAGGTYRLKRLVGEAKALKMILTGQNVRGSIAHSIGLSDHLVQRSGNETKVAIKEKTLKEAVMLANLICEGGPRAIGAALRAVRGGDQATENECYDEVVRTEDRDEALRAFGEKRRAMFRGL
ncbi:MAG: hypothetical protein Q9217_000444 [Psora testacea]